MSENKIIQLFTDGQVNTKDGREFTRLLGGFNENSPIITTKQISELLDKQVKHVNEVINGNIKHFSNEDDEYIKDLKVVGQNDHNLEVLKSLGYTNMAISKAKNIYVLSQAGFLLYLKFAEGDKAVELYKEFIEDYFKLQAENIVMKKTLDEELEFLKDQRAVTLGRMFIEQDEVKKLEYFNEQEKINNRMKEIELTLSKEKLVEQLQPKLHIADKFTNIDSCYDVGTFSKVLHIKGLGRNNLFEWMRDQKILMANNQPYQKYIDYFKVIAMESKYNDKINYKTMIKPNGVEYIIKRLIKDNKVITKSVDVILSELESTNQAS